MKKSLLLFIILGMSIQTAQAMDKEEYFLTCPEELIYKGEGTRYGHPIFLYEGKMGGDVDGIIMKGDADEKLPKLADLEGRAYSDQPRLSCIYEGPDQIKLEVNINDHGYSCTTEHEYRHKVKDWFKCFKRGDVGHK